MITHTRTLILNMSIETVNSIDTIKNKIFYFVIKQNTFFKRIVIRYCDKSETISLKCLFHS